MNTDTSGCVTPLQEGLVRHIDSAIERMTPVNQPMTDWLARAPENRLTVCAERSGQDAATRLNHYLRVANGAASGVDAPLPMLLIAFGRETQPAPADAGRSIAAPQNVQLVSGGPWYQMRVDYVEKTAQLIFVADENLTAAALASQLRMSLKAFNGNRFDVRWQFGGFTYSLSAQLETDEPLDEPQDLPDNANLTVILWSLPLRFQMPYLNSAASGLIEAGVFAGHDKGFAVTSSINARFADQSGQIQSARHSDAVTPDYGQWLPAWPPAEH